MGKSIRKRLELTFTISADSVEADIREPDSAVCDSVTAPLWGGDITEELRRRLDRYLDRWAEECRDALLGVEAADGPQSIRFLIPLAATKYGPEYDDSLEVSTYELTAYKDEIEKAIDRDPLETDDLDEVDFLKDLTFGVTVVDKQLYGVAECGFTRPITDRELENLKSAIAGQLSDGWGEAFEQRAIRIPDSRRLYVSFWQPSGWELLTDDGHSDKH